MTLPAYLSAFLSLPTLGLALFCWPCRHLAVAPPLAPLCLGLALLLIFNALFLLAAEISDPTLAVAKMLFWAGWFTIAMTAVSCSTLWLVLSWRPLPWPAGWQRLLAAALADSFLPAPVSTGVISWIHRLRSAFPSASFPTNRPREVLGLFWDPDPTGQPEPAAAELDSIPLTLSAATG